MSRWREPTYKRFITGSILRFDDRNGSLSRHQRETTISPDKVKTTRKIPSLALHQFTLQGDPTRVRKGYEQKDYALLWPPRVLDFLVRRNLYSRDLEVNPNKVDVSDKAAVTRDVKAAAHLFGADLVGICKFNPIWVYSHWGDYNAFYMGGIASPGDPIQIPPWVKYVVVMAIEMDYASVKLTPAIQPSTEVAYAKMAFAASSVAEYIRQSGFHAMACGNECALSIPLAIDAGLGELSRMGLLITEQFGPRVRLCKVFTELPLEVDSPIDIGVQDFCERCQRCAEACPGRAIMFGDRTDKAWDEGNNINVLKWPIKGMNCLSWWERNRGSCEVCIRVCPFNKPKGLLHSSVRKVVKTSPLFDKLFVKIDGALGYGKQVIK